MRYFITAALMTVFSLIGTGLQAEGKDQVLKIRSDLEKAYAQGLEENKPIVVIFVCPLERESCVHCKRFRGVLFTPELAKFNQDAIFVLVDVDQSGKTKPTVGYQLFKKLGGKSTPMISCLEPNAKQITERVRFQGFFTAEKLGTQFTKYLRGTK